MQHPCTIFYKSIAAADIYVSGDRIRRKAYSLFSVMFICLIYPPSSFNEQMLIGSTRNQTIFGSVCYQTGYNILKCVNDKYLPFSIISNQRYLNETMLIAPMSNCNCIPRWRFDRPSVHKRGEKLVQSSIMKLNRNSTIAHHFHPVSQSNVHPSKTDRRHSGNPAEQRTI